MTDTQLQSLLRVADSVPLVDLEVAKSRFGVMNPGERYNTRVADCTPQWSEFFATFDPPTVKALLELAQQAA